MQDILREDSYNNIITEFPQFPGKGIWHAPHDVVNDVGYTYVHNQLLKTNLLLLQNLLALKHWMQQGYKKYCG